MHALERLPGFGVSVGLELWVQAPRHLYLYKGEVARRPSWPQPPEGTPQQ